MDNVVTGRSILKSSLLIGILCGCAAVLLDADHIPCLLGFTKNCRPAHIPALIISVIGISCVGGYIICLLLIKLIKS